MAQLIRKIVSTPKGPKPVGPYNQAVQVGHMLYVSGVLGLDVSSSKLVPGGAPFEAEQVLINLGAVLEAGGSSYGQEHYIRLKIPGNLSYSGKNYFVVEKRMPIIELAFFKKAMLVANGSAVVKSTIFLSDMNDFPVVNEAYKKYFKEPFPARSTFQVGKLPLNAKVEIEVIAVTAELIDN